SHVGLDWDKTYTVIVELAGTPGAHKPSAIVLVRSRINQFCADYTGLSETHAAEDPLSQSVSPPGKRMRSGSPNRAGFRVVVPDPNILAAPLHSRRRRLPVFPV